MEFYGQYSGGMSSILFAAKKPSLDLAANEKSLILEMNAYVTLIFL